MFTKSGRLIMLNMIFAGVGSFVDRYYRLSTNVPGGDPDDVVVGDFTQATFNGYAQIANPTMADAAIDGSNRGKIFTPTLTWTAGAGISAQTVKCIYVVTNSNLANLQGLLWWMELPAWVTLSNPGEEVNQVCTFYDRDFTP